MALKPVTDPAILGQLQTVAPAGRQPVTDPTLLAQLNAPTRFGSGKSFDIDEDGNLVPSGSIDLSPSVLGTVGEKAANLVLGAPEAAASLVSSAFAGVKGVTEGAGATVGELATRARGDALPAEEFNPVNVAADTIRSNTFAPVTERGKAAVEQLAAGPEALGTGAGAGARALGVPEPIANEIEMQTPNVLNAALTLAGGPKVGAEVVAPRGAAARPAAVPDVVQTARSAGYRVRPSDVQAVAPGAKVPGVTRERLQNPADLVRDDILHNQTRSTDISAQDIGLKNVDYLDNKAFDSVKAPEFKIYEQADAAIRKVPPSPEFTQLVAEGADAAKLQGPVTTTKVIGALRRKAVKDIASDDVKTQEAGYAKRDMAEKIEASFGEQLAAIGEDKLLPAYQAARQRLAKIHDVESATKAGQVNAAKLADINKRNPNRLTGGLKLVADVGEYLPNVTRHSTKTAASAKAAADTSKSGIIKGVTKGVLRNIPGLDVRRTSFQNKFGEEAPPGTDFSSYGARPARAAPEAPSEAGGLPFETTAGVPPGRVQTLAGDLGLTPEQVAGAERFPEAPGRLTADQVPPVRGDVNFQPSQLEAETLAGELGLEAPRAAPEGLDFTTSPDVSLAEGLGLAPPRLREQGKLPVATPQRPELSLTAPPSEKSAPVVQHAVTKGGQHTFRIEDGGELVAKDLPDEGRLQIVESKVPEGKRGEGRGAALYKAALDKAKKLGRALVSDNRVSEPAQKRWAALEKEGVKVKRNPAKREASGELVSKSELKPVFEVIGTAATE